MAKKAPKEEPVNLLPANLEAEQSLLGALLIRPAMMDDVADLLSASDFYREAHGRIYRAMAELYLRNEPIDLKTVGFLLHERGQLEKVGGAVFLAGLSEQVGIAANAVFYARLVKKMATLRRLLAATQEISAACLSPVEDLPEFLDWAESKIYEHKEGLDGGQAIYSLDELYPEESDHIEQIHYRKKDLLGVPSGFIDLDELTSGWIPSDLILLAARPGMGKTALALNMAFHAAKHGGVPVGVISMEQSRSQLTQRLIASVGMINASKLRSAKMSMLEWATFAEVGEKIMGAPLYMVDKPALTLMQIRSYVRRLKSRHGIGLVVVDYLQQAREPRAKSPVEVVSAISQGLKALAKEMDLPVIALCQLNRDVEKRPNKRPSLQDLKGSGSLEQEADVILFIYRDDYYKPDHAEKGKAEIILAKHRNGPTGKVKLAYLPEYLLFTNLAREEEPADAGF